MTLPRALRGEATYGDNARVEGGELRAGCPELVVGHPRRDLALTARAARMLWAFIVGRRAVIARRPPLSNDHFNAASTRPRSPRSRSAGSLENTKRTNRSLRWLPQPVIAVAATLPRSSNRADASAPVSPSDDTSISIDHPPSGLTTGSPASSSSITSRRRCHSATAAATSESGVRSATVAPGWAIPTGHTTFEMLTNPMSLMISGGATIQPTRHPIIRYSLDTAPTVIVRSAMPGIDAGWLCSAESNRMRSIALSTSIHAPAFRQARQIASQSSRENTPPPGIDGLIIRKTLVFDVTAPPT